MPFFPGSCRYIAPRFHSRPNGFSFLEFLVAFILLTLAFIPLFLSTQTTVQHVAITGRHLLATQAAQSLLDRYMSLPFNQCVASLTSHSALTGPVPYLSDPEISALMELPELDSLKTELQENAHISMDFTYQIDCLPKPEEITFQDTTLKIRVTVFFQVKRGSANAASEVQTMASGIKFREML